MRLALRSLWKTPSFSVVALLALALGIGANTAIFSVIDAILLRPLPFDRPQSLVFLQENRHGSQPISVSFPNFRDWQAQTGSLEMMAARQGTSYTLLGHGEAQQIEGSNVTAELFPLLGVKPILGRTFRADEDKPGSERVAVITFGCWQRVFNGAAEVLGEQLTLDGEPYSVIGVMPAGFRYPYTHLKGEVFTSLGRVSDQISDRGARAGVYVLGRLRPNATIDTVRAELNTIAKRLQQQYPAANHGVGVDADLLQERMVRGIRPALVVLLVAVTFVMLIACGNVAGLLIARAASRRRELAIRAALGAGRRHLIRQLLAEGVVLSLCGGVLGTMFAALAVQGLAAITPSDTPRASEIAFDTRALLFTLAISLAAGILFGLVPLWEAGRRDVYETIKSGAAGSSGTVRQRARSVLVAVEMALSTALLVGAGLLLSSFTRLSHTSAGLQPENVTAFQLSLSDTAYATPAARAAFGEQLMERVQSLPGVQSIGLVHPLPLSGFGNQIGIVPAGKVVTGLQDVTTVDYIRATPDYFRAVEIRLAAGRTFTSRDREGAPPVCIVDQTLARQFFPNESAVGKRLISNPLHGAHSGTFEIVGVVGHVKSYGVDQPSRVEVYVPYAQSPSGGMTLMVKSALAPGALVPAIRQELRQIDANQPFSNVVPMTQVVAETTAQQRLSATVVSVFAGAALLLAAVGLYGVVSYSVTQRTREFGVRIALGASTRNVLGLVLRQGAVMAASGVCAGLVAAVLLTRRMSASLFGVSALDPLTFSAVTLLLGLVAIVASYVPARRATRVDPVTALRSE